MFPHPNREPPNASGFRSAASAPAYLRPPNALPRHVSAQSLGSSSVRPPPSVSPSNEADDERSDEEDSDLTSMGPGSTASEEEDRGGGPAYDGEDTRLTSDKEMRGWYTYGWAAEVFVVCGMGSFIPITLEQLARESGYLESDRSTPCPVSGNVPDPFNPNTTALAYSDAPPADAQQCVVPIFGIEINTASFAMYTFSISVLVQALLIISMSGAADHGKFRRLFLTVFAFIGSVATMLFLPIVPQVFILGAILAILSNTCFGASFVLLNSFLPVLVRHHPEVLLDDGSEVDYSGIDHYHEPADETSALLSPTGTDPTIKNVYSKQPESTSRELQLSSRISSYGIGIGYVAALLVQSICILVVRAMHSSLLSLRVALFIIGAWWFVFTIPAALWLRPRPGPSLHMKERQTVLSASWIYFNHSWKSLWRTIRHARRLKDMLLFLAAWFMISDAVATVSGTAILFAKTSLEMKPAALALITTTATLSGIAGAFTWSKISTMAGVRPAQTILACICLFELIPIYGLLGYIPAIRRLGVLGLQQPWEMYPLGAVYGFVMGGLSSFCRSFFGELIPPGYEAAFYALYAITDKGSSVFGPAIVGAITDATGEIRPAFWFLAVLIAIPFPLMMAVDVERGRRDGFAMAAELAEAEALQAGHRIARHENGPINLIDEEDDERHGRLL